jgi:nitrogen fixation/metabolism regulation signal transduction histidine kinase
LPGVFREAEKNKERHAMKIHRKLVLLVGLGMLLITLVTILSLQFITSAFSRTIREMNQISHESEQVGVIERKIDEMWHAVQSYAITGNPAYFKRYEQAQAEAKRALRETAVRGRKDNAIHSTLESDLESIRKKAQRIFSFKTGLPDNQKLVSNILAELDSLHAWIARDVADHEKTNASEMERVLGQLRRSKVTINIVFLLVVLTSLGSLFAFIVYIHRKISVPLNNLWEGTEEISRGNLDYQMQVKGESDIARLAKRFNEMSQKLRFSYAELEQKLYERTHELASLDAVALTLSHAGTLRDMLDKSLLKVLESLARIEPKGGIFLCNPGGETLGLVAHKGLSQEFVERETVIGMGECLCGIVARPGNWSLPGTDAKIRATRETGGTEATRTLSSR